MVYSQKQIKLIQKKRPDLRFQRIPTLDDLILNFLKKFDIVFKTSNYKSNNLENNKEQINYFKELNLNEIKEWEMWKKWALEHPDFEAFRVNKIEENQIFNKKILDKINSEEIKVEFMDTFKKSNNFKINKLLFFVLILLGLIFSYKFLLLLFSQNNENVSYLSYFKKI